METAKQEGLELELTYLAKVIPEGLRECKSKDLLDIYLPATSAHPKLRLRKRGDVCEMTKKNLVKEGDASVQIEQTIALDEAEFAALSAVGGKRVHKQRFYFPYENVTAEVDVFQDSLAGLVLIDFEFASEEEKNTFQMPSFCLADVAQEDFVAGGMLCGKSYEDITADLARFGYQKLSL
jgi:CYTH domain-containing protein